MNLKAVGQAQLAGIMAAQPDAVVTVSSGARTTTGVRSATRAEADLADSGEMGVTTGTVWCNADELGIPARGATIMVGGSAAFVLSTVRDPVGALVRVDYQVQKPKA